MKYKEILDSYRDEIARLLRGLVSFRSVKSGPLEGKPFGEEVHKAYTFLLNKAEEDGFDIFDADGWGGHIEWRGAVTDDRGEILDAANETLGIAVHLDVVPAGEGWTRDPWAGETVYERIKKGAAPDNNSPGVSEERIYGRGTSDNKGAAAIVYYAMKALRDSGYVPAKNIRLILGLDEETGWSGMDKYYEQTPPPDFGLAPDAEFPVIHGEKGMMIFEIAKKLEPANEKGLIVRSINGGNAPNMVPDFCRAILVYEDSNSGKEGRSGKAGKSSSKSKENNPGQTSVSNTGQHAGKIPEARDRAFALVREAAAVYNEKNTAVNNGKTLAKISCKGTGNAFEVSAKGISAHGATPEKGVNAVSTLMGFLSTLPLANESARDFIDFYQTSIGRETDGKSLGLAMKDELSGSLIVNAGMIDVNRDVAVLTINIRYPVSKKEDDIYDAIRPLLDENGLGVVKISNNAPLYFAPDEPFIKTLMEVYRENTGDNESGPIVIGGGTYARAMPNAVAFGIRFPGEEETAHQKDEYISFDSLMRAAHIYADAIRRLGQKGTYLVSSTCEPEK